MLELENERVLRKCHEWSPIAVATAIPGDKAPSIWLHHENQPMTIRPIRQPNRPNSHESGLFGLFKSIWFLEITRNHHILPLPIQHLFSVYSACNRGDVEGSATCFSGQSAWNELGTGVQGILTELTTEETMNERKNSTYLCSWVFTDSSARYSIPPFEKWGPPSFPMVISV